MMKPFSLLKPVQTQKPDKAVVHIKHCQTRAEVKRLIDNLDELVALDFETNGSKAHEDNCHVVGVGLADSKTILYFDVKDKPDIYDQILLSLEGKQLFGFNINFDAGFMHRDWSKKIDQPVSGYGLQWHNWKYDVYALYKQLSNEGWAGQEWNLKAAQIDLLGWDSKGDVELTRWLVDNDHYTVVSTTPLNDYVYRSDLNRYCRPDRSKMHLAPPEILGYYCGLDAASTYMLLTEVFLPCVESLPSSAQELFWFYHQELFITNVKWHIEQQLRGIYVDTESLTAYTKDLTGIIHQAESDFLNHDDIKPHIIEWNQLSIAKKLGKQPAELTKAGKPSKNYINWLAKKEKLAAESHFNLNSGAQRQWLFYEKLGHEVLLRTEKGNPAVDKKALLAWGEPGQILKLNNDKTKELGYVQSCIEMVKNSVDGLLHPQYRLPGTLTCRIAGAGSFNIQQQPKSKGYLKHWQPLKGHIWVDADVESLEAVVLAELSKDKTMRYLYDPSSPKNDIYLYVGSFLPGIGERIRAAGYDPNNPTAEGIANAKKLAKHERQIAKVCVLGFQYGMGPKKLRMTLRLEGINMSEQESYDIYNAYWELFLGIREYQNYLEGEWRKRGGWVYNGIGRPVCCYEPYLKDIVNRVVQSTGHDILMYVNYQLYNIREENQIDFWPIIIDWHDASLVECQIGREPIVLKMFHEAYRRTNEWLKGDLLIRTKPQVVHNLAESKCE